MTVAIHPVHRRLAELHLKAKKQGGFHRLSILEQGEVFHCLIVNADLVQKIDGLKELSLQAYMLGDTAWVQDIEKELNAIASSCNEKRY